KKQEAEAAARKDAERQKQQAKERDPKRKQDADAARKEPRAPRTFDRTKADQEFERARKEAQQKGGNGPAEAWRPQAVNKFEELRKGRKTREEGSRNIITEPDKRVIIRDEKRTFIRHDETARLAGKGREVRRERQKDGTWLVVTAGLAGALIYSLQDDDGRVMRRSRRDKDGREHVLFDDRHSRRGGHGHGHGYSSVYIDLPAPVISIPRDRYIVDYDRASPDDLYDALNAPPVERLQRHYSLNEVRQNYSVLERMRRVDLDAINFAFASWDVGEDQYPKLERIARAMHRVLDRSPNELFLIEGHTDAVGNEIDNLSLSDRRAEMVATILTDVFDVPPENLVTQGYGEGYLKEMTEAPSRINRRVAVRRITPLLARDGWDD
ncbi:OmpA family protein, partial [Hyphomicrobium sp.]|uniref:OmpA family protein n=1 Tax=Hyphomicrobium sp. TaxID=82 RepID=UPI002FDDF4F0